MPEPNKKEGEEIAEGEKKPEGEIDYKAKSEELEAEITKLKSKDTSFSKFKKMTEEEQAKSIEEKEAMSKKISELESSIKANSEAQRKEVRDTLVSTFTGGDEDKAKEIMAEYNLLNMPDGTRSEIQARLAKAAKLAGYEIKGDLSSIQFGSGNEPAKTEKRFTDTEKGKAFFNSMFPNAKIE